jgi:hypothetical protein
MMFRAHIFSSSPSPALSQILVVADGAIEDEDRTESFVGFYDIFTRHAFGNYFDILKEVTYHPLMAEML